MSTTQQPVAHVKVEPPETTATVTAQQASITSIAAPPPAALVGVAQAQAPSPKVSPAPVPSSAHAAAVAAAQAAARGVPATVKPKQSKKASKAAASSPPSPQVTMATAATATTSSTSKGGENTGRWTAEEHRLFLQGLEQHGKGWKKIASLIKSRTVVQIRTHAQKYFQKLAKARQNGEEGEVSMEGRGAAGVPSIGVGGPSAGGPGAAQAKRRRQASGTKRRAISSVVASAQREGKKQATAAAASATAGTPSATPPPPLPAVAPALAPFVVQAPPAPLPAPAQIAAHQQPGQAQPQPPHQQQQQQQQVPGITTAHGTISGAALEDSLFRFLTPVTGDAVHPIPASAPQVNEVARKAGANPIVLPSDSHPGAPSAAQAANPGGDISPTGVADLTIYPSWTESKEPPAWYSSGRDVDELLHEADALDWLADSGDLHETYVAPQQYQHAAAKAEQGDVASLCSENTEPNPVPGVKPAAPSTSDLTVDSAMPPLPSLFGSSADVSSGAAEPPAKKQKVSSSSTASLFASATEAADATLKQEAGAHEDHLAVFDAHFDEQAFVSALLDNNGESSASLPTLQ